MNSKSFDLTRRIVGEWISELAMDVVSKSARVSDSRPGTTRLSIAGILFVILLAVIVCAAPTQAAGPTYTVGRIPTLEVSQTGMLTFQLQSPRAGTATFSYSVNPTFPAPKGSLTLNSSTGVFTYTPSPSDTSQFQLMFSSTVSGKPPDQQLVSIFPRRTLPPESDLINRVDRIPDPSGNDYFLDSCALNSPSEMFNGVMKQTRNCQVSGKVIAIDASIPSNSRLYNSYNNASDV